MMRAVSRLLAVMCASLCSWPCWADEPDGNDAIRAVIHAIDARPPVDTNRFVLTTALWDDSAKPAKSESCFAIDRVVVSGIELIDPAELKTAIRPFAGPCLGNTLVKGVMLAINGVYAKHGYVTTQAYLPKQDLKNSRVLEVVIKVGRVNDVRYTEAPVYAEGTYFARIGNRVTALFAVTDLNSFFTALDGLAETIDDPLEQPLIANPAGRLWPATVVKAGDPLELDAMQHGLDNMNKVPSSRAQAKLEPGTDPSSSIVVINNRPEDAFRVVTGYDTYGTRATGVDRSRIEISRDNLIGVNDGWKASLTSAKNSNELTAGFVLPVRWFNLTADIKYSESLVPVGSYAELFAQNGSASVGGVVTASRTPTGRLDLTAGVRLSGNDRTINDVALTPQRFVALQGGFSRQWTLGKSGMLTLGGTYSQGLDAWIATSDPPDADSKTPRAQYKKVEGNASLNWAPLDGVTLSSTLQTQWSNSPLYAADQLTLGSLSSIRGFKEAPFSVDRGGIWRNELSARLPVDWFFGQAGWKGDPWVNNRLKGFEGYLFLDGGYGQDIANGKDDLIIGTGFGVRYRDSRITADWSLARGVYEKAKAAPDTTEIYLNIGVKVF